jgi:hypothetical protein
LALVRDKRMTVALESEISSALEATLYAISGGANPGFDLAHQAASLMLPLALANDDAAAEFADRLASAAPDNVRMLRELALSLAAGTGESTRRSLDKLQRLGKPAVTEEVKKSLERRNSESR